MEEWLSLGLEQVRAKLEVDPYYQALSERLSRAEDIYKAVLSTLTEQEKAYIEDYIALCEESDYQWIHTAYRCGKMNR